MEIFLRSESAKVSKSMRGAKAYIAKRKIKYSDDEHTSDIKKGEKFYLKKLGKRFYLMDSEKQGGKEVFYQFRIDEKTYNDFASKHQEVDKSDSKVAGKKPSKKGDKKNPSVKKGDSDKKTSAKPKAKSTTAVKKADAAIDKAIKGGVKDKEQLTDLRDKLVDGGFKVSKKTTEDGKQKVVMTSPDSDRKVKMTLTDRVKAFFAKLF